jgi:hypothetical protein
MSRWTQNWNQIYSKSFSHLVLLSNSLSTINLSLHSWLLAFFTWLIYSHLSCILLAHTKRTQPDLVETSKCNTLIHQAHLLIDTFSSIFLRHPKLIALTLLEHPPSPCINPGLLHSQASNQSCMFMLKHNCQLAPPHITCPSRLFHLTYWLQIT